MDPLEGDEEIIIVDSDNESEPMDHDYEDKEGDNSSLMDFLYSDGGDKFQGDDDDDDDDDEEDIILPSYIFSIKDDVKPEPKTTSSVTEQSSLDKLKAMFPNTDENYIRQMCEQPPIDAHSEDDNFAHLVNQLLAYEEHLDESVIEVARKSMEEDVDESVKNDLELSKTLEMLEREKVEEEARNRQLLHEMLEREKLEEEARNQQLLDSFLQKERLTNVDQKMEILENILPDANPDELKKIVEANGEDSEFIELFVESKLDDRNYEKRAEYFDKLRRRMLAEEYTSKFSIENFLKQLPEPVEHFENPSRKCSFHELAFNYLKSIYPDLEDQVLREKYSHFQYNLSLTVKDLKRQNWFPTRSTMNHGIEDVALLQEIAFIENYNEILLYLEAVKESEEQELQKLRAENLLLECQCCYDEMKPYESTECSNGHIFCKRCIIRGTNFVISNGDAALLCFQGCNSEIGLDVLRRVLPANTYETLLKKRQDVEVMAANISDLAVCPFCPYIMELGPDIQIFMCKNPECKKISCRKCKRLNHLPIKCEDVLDEHKGRLYVEEEMTKGLIVYCYNCKRPFVKDSGCNFMTCQFCKVQWCHICKQPTRGHSHLGTNNNCHNIQGNEMYDKQQVNLRRDQAIEKLSKDFPDLKLPNL